MRELSDRIDKSSPPEEEDIIALAETQIRQNLAFKELRNYNLTGEFLGEHPLIIHQKEYSDLELLRKSNPSAFLQEFARCNKNVQRYRGYIKDSKKKKEKENNQRLLDKHVARMEVFNKILSDEND
ncbi:MULTISPECIES: hypothetical protein [Porphyromonas]|uniref:Uncharacterized protein n=3 Tax=Viruses TaxID=10239 RepID=A0AAT9JG86_9CAUD|nr:MULTISPECIES: hypothetical protein [Porphyromonas]ERJ70625.1 hypothetical protein HMPREF1553_00170 [Porphyromonas gingivalis F0568]KGL49881.1 hypothetical protein HQ49_02020 [Porphyromonas gulae]MCE8187118.1 hypothetical protein [Porphyromonas gingivalis]MCE8191136.1 hypothetical protein [Porphyromonas gingivalis]